MKWFFALNETGNEFAEYGQMAKVAVLTALARTTLEPHFIYDGEENDLTEWMRGKNVKVIKKRSFLFDDLQQIAARRNNELFLNIGAGAFLRLEVPQIVEQLNYNDKFVLYTDVDVMFEAEVTDYLQSVRPKYFAVAPEFSQKDRNSMNSGVMVMNIENLAANETIFRRYVKENLAMLVDESFDQGAYRLFYRRENRIWRKLFGNRWTALKPEYNWKPYWGKSAGVKIIHFHGPKPHQREVLFSENIPEHLKSIVSLKNGGYFEYVEEWRRFAESADAQN